MDVQAGRWEVGEALDRFETDAPTCANNSELWGLAFDLGLSRVDLPLGCGGLGLPRKFQKQVDLRMKELGVESNYLLNDFGIATAAPAIALFGTDAQTQLLRRIFTTEEIWCQLFSEPEAGSDLAGLRTTACRDGDEWILSGQKIWSTMAHEADRGMLLARTSDVPRHRGISCFLLDMHLPGVTVRPIRQMTGDADFCEVFFDDVRVPDSARLGEVDEGWRVCITALMNERTGIGILAEHGIAPIEDVLSLWRKLPVDAHGAVQRDALVRCWMRAKLLELTGIRSAANEESGKPGPEGSIMKLLLSEQNKQLWNLCMDLLGAGGMLYSSYEMVQHPKWWKGEVQRSFLESRAHTIGGGTSEIQRNTLGERVLGLPREPRSFDSNRGTSVGGTDQDADLIDLGLEGRTVVVTGGSSGIGNGIARAFLGQGANVHVTGTRPTADDYAGVQGSDLTGLQFHQLDVADSAAVASFSPSDTLDVLVNSVGAVAYRRAEYEPDTFENIVNVNLIGVMRCCVRFHDALAQSKGAIVNVGSTSSFVATPGQPAYSASKGGLLTLTRSLADAWGRDGIRVNGIAPGFVATRLTQVTRERADLYEQSLRSIPLGRWGSPEEMGSVAMFLASPLASYVAGQMLLVDGGLTLR